MLVEFGHLCALITLPKLSYSQHFQDQKHDPRLK